MPASSNTILFQEVLSLRQIFVSFGIWHATAGNPRTSPSARKTGPRIALPFPTSNWNDVFSDVFGKAASAITTRIRENPSERITDVSGFRTKRMKTTDQEILTAVDGEMCAEQAEKLRVVRSASSLKFVRVSYLEASLFLGWSYAAEQRERWQKENN